MLSDRGVDENHVPMPSLLAVSAVHQHLVKTKKRTALAIILESGEPREVHHFATPVSYTHLMASLVTAQSQTDDQWPPEVFGNMNQVAKGGDNIIFLV